MPGGVHPSLEVIHSWPKPNYVNPERHSWAVPATTIGLFVVTITIVAIRFYVRLTLQKNASWDDGLVALAMIPTVVFVGAVIGGCRIWGFDRHVWDSTPEMLESSRKTVYVIEVSYLASITLTKISILFFYRRLGNRAISTTFRWILRLTIAYVLLLTLALVTPLSLYCRPLYAYWKQSNSLWASTHKPGIDYQCIEEGVFSMTVTVMVATQDLLVVSLPLILFWELKLDMVQKIGLAAIFIVGGLICITSAAVRIWTTWRTFYQTYDVTWVAQESWVTMAIETLVALTSASLPALKTLFLRLNASGSLHKPPIQLKGANLTLSEASEALEAQDENQWPIKPAARRYVRMRHIEDGLSSPVSLGREARALKTNIGRARHQPIVVQGGPDYDLWVQHQYEDSRGIWQTEDDRRVRIGARGVRFSTCTLWPSSQARGHVN